MGTVRRLWNIVRRGRLDDDLRQELETHLALIEDEERAHGLSVGEARREARLRFGNPLSHRERALDNVIATGVEHVWNDLRHAVRTLYKSPGFTVVAVLSLALGIGVNTAMFTVINAVLLRQLPYPQPSQLVVLTQQDGRSDLAIPEYDVVRQQGHVFSAMAAYRGAGERRIEWSGGEDWIASLHVTADFLRTLGIPPVLGRTFDDEEMHAGGPQAIILSEEIWRRSFLADPTILGQMVMLDGTPFKVVGVMPARFWLPQQRTDALIPLRRSGGLDDLGTNTRVVARLKERVDQRQAQADIATLTDSLRQARGAGAAASYRGLSVSSFQASLVGDVRLNLWLLFAGTVLLLLLACVNLAMLLITRFTARGREIAVRVALGSGLHRLLMQFLVENLVLTGLGVAASIGAAYALVQGLVAWIPFGLPAAAPIRIDRAVLGFALTVAAGTALVLTLVPLFITRRLHVHDALKSTTRTVARSNLRARTRNLLVVTEVALSTTLLIAAGLLIHSLYRIQQERLGFSTDALLTFVTPFDRSRTAADRAGFFRELRERLQKVPGVRGVAATNVLPLTGQGNLPTQREGHPEQSIGGMEIRTVTANYFELLGIPLRRGRPFTSNDRAASLPVAIINETVARNWWPAGDAIGDRLVVGLFQGRRFGDDPPREVIGIVGDTKTVTVKAPPRPTVFVPADQALGDASSLAWLVKSDASPDLAANVRTVVASIDRRQRILQLRSMDEIVASTSATSRFNALLFAMFAAVAVVLTAIGLYGVLSFLVGHRSHEVGTRMALGAGRADVLRLFLAQGVMLTAVGLALGLAVALLLTRWLSTLLYGVQAHDPASFVAVAVLVFVLGAAASYLPARRAASIDPMMALRSE
jgi:putative ABC transport system permease protein